MRAVIEIAGTQFEVSQDLKLNVPRLSGEPGEMVDFQNILAISNGDDITVGTPYLEGKVTARILDHGKGDKVLVFHKKRRKGYRKLNGFRAKYSNIEITNINLNN